MAILDVSNINGLVISARSTCCVSVDNVISLLVII